MQENGTEHQPHVLTVSTAAIVKIAALLLVVGFLYLIRDIILLFFVSLILASIINPLASWFQAKKMSRGLAVLLLYAAMVALIALVLIMLVPAVVKETRDLLMNSGALWNRLLSAFGPLRDFAVTHGFAQSFQQAAAGASDNVGAAASRLFATLSGVVTGIASFIIVLVVAFYLVVSEDALKRLFRALAPDAYQPYLVDLFQRIEKSIGGWVRGQLILSAIVGLAFYVALQLLGVKYALVLALTAGVAESIPYVGPIFSAIPAILIAFTDSPLKALLVAVVCIVIQQAENHILVPKVMQKVTGLHPIVSIFAMLIGVKIAGLLGALLAIPVAMMAGIIAADAFRFLKSHR